MLILRPRIVRETFFGGHVFLAYLINDRTGKAIRVPGCYMARVDAYRAAWRQVDEMRIRKD